MFPILWLVFFLNLFLVLFDKLKVIILMNLNFCVNKIFFLPWYHNDISFIMILSASGVHQLLFRCIIHLELTFKYSMTEESYYILLLMKNFIFYHSIFPSLQGWNLRAVSISLVVTQNIPTCKLNLSKSKFNQYFYSSPGHY